MSFFRGPQFPELMIDIETLSTQPNAAIISIAAVLFNIETKQFATPTFYEEIDHVTLNDFHKDPKTLAWWEKQQQPIPQGTTSIESALRALIVFIEKTPPARIWANSPSFDLVILKHACSHFDLVWPIAYWQERDVRTLKDVAKAPKNFNATHNAIEDCISQIRVVTDCFNAILLK